MALSSDGITLLDRGECIMIDYTTSMMDEYGDTYHDVDLESMAVDGMLDILFEEGE